MFSFSYQFDSDILKVFVDTFLTIVLGQYQIHARLNIDVVTS